MRSFLRVSSLVLLAGSSGCVGGPVSDWPAKNSDHGGGKDDGDDISNAPRTPPSGAGALDAGLSAPSDDANAGIQSDGGADGGVPCTTDAGACRAACIDDAGALSPDSAAARPQRGCSDR